MIALLSRSVLHYSSVRNERLLKHHPPESWITEIIRYSFTNISLHNILGEFNYPLLWWGLQSQPQRIPFNCPQGWLFCSLPSHHEHASRKGKPLTTFYRHFIDNIPTWFTTLVLLTHAPQENKGKRKMSGIHGTELLKKTNSYYGNGKKIIQMFHRTQITVYLPDAIFPPTIRLFFSLTHNHTMSGWKLLLNRRPAIFWN